MLKNFVRKALNTLHLDLTKNLEYDRLTRKIIKQVVTPQTICADVGCHKGEILDLITEQAPSMRHYAFEPIPAYYEQLKKKYPDIELFPYALSDRNGTAEFHFVKNAPAYSGLKKRAYSVGRPEIELIEVQLKPLDEVIPEDEPVKFIKIDVEGAEYQVIKGSEKTIERNKPYLIFEFGLGAADHYGTSPEAMYEMVTRHLKLNTLKGFLNQSAPLTEEEFSNLYHRNSEYYFIAFP